MRGLIRILQILMGGLGKYYFDTTTKWSLTTTKLNFPRVLHNSVHMMFLFLDF